MKTKYDWSAVPSQYNWLATNSNGFAIAHETKPILIDGFSDSWFMGGNYSVIHFPVKNPFKGNWKDSLEERPSDE